MKKLIAISLIAVSLAGCGKPAWIDGKEYGTYGLFNEKTHKNPSIEYDISVGNVIWSAILIETVVFPIYFVGFSLWNPVGKVGSLEKGVVR